MTAASILRPVLDIHDDPPPYIHVPLLSKVIAKIKQKFPNFRAKRMEVHEATDADQKHILQLTEYTTREIDQAIDTVAIIPKHPDFVVVGTYGLNKIEESQDGDQPPQIVPASRFGSLQILPYDAGSNSRSITSTRLDRRDFPCGIYNIHFHPHPNYNNLLGAATTTGAIRFFNIVRINDASQESSAFHIIEIGILQLYTSDNDLGSTPLITQFTWLPHFRPNIVLEDENPTFHVTLGACDSAGVSHIVAINTLADIRDPTDARIVNQDVDGIPAITDVMDGPNHFLQIHKRDFEAWCIACLHTHGRSTYIISGGDDSALIATEYHPVPSGLSDPSPVLTNRRTHTAGIVSVLPLQPHEIYGGEFASVPLLTGSYDEHIRLFLFNTRTNALVLHTSLQIVGGGIFKLKLLDEYMVDKRLNYILLVSAMYVGVRIVRLSVSSKMDWKWQVEAKLEEPHRSIVYASVAKEVEDKWKIMSTSFYDMKICGWEWVDEIKQKNAHGGLT